MSASSFASTPPVLLLAFSRPDLLCRVLEKVRAARPARLFLAVDGPRPGRADDLAATTACRALAAKVDWPCEVRTRFLEENQGCKLAISGAISWFFEHVEEGIILEEDCVPGAAFFPFCSELLARYRDDERVGMISGNNFHPAAKWRDSGHAFTRYAFVWGWATWRRAWQKYDRDLVDWPERRTGDWLRKLHGSEAEARHWRVVLDDCYVGRRYDTWDYQWMYSCWKAGMLCAYPMANLVANVGFDERGTHTTRGGDSNENVPVKDAHAAGPTPMAPRAATESDRELAERYYKLRRRPGTAALRALSAGARRAGWGLLGAVAGGGRLGIFAAARRLRAWPEARPGRARFAGQTWEFGDAPRFAAELDRLWVRRGLEFRARADGPFIIDCGAGWGVATLFWARRWPRARVLALEPDPAMLPRLRHNLAAAGAPVAARVELRSQALWRSDGRAPFLSMPDGRGHVVDDPRRGMARHLVEVETVTPSSLLAGREVDLLKLTLAGAEHALFDEPGVLARVARVYVDCHLGGRRQARIEDLLAALRAAGFRLHVQAEPLAPRPFVRRGEEEGTLQRVQIYAYRE